MLCEWVWMLVSACVCVSFLLRSARPEISLSITNDEWPEKWTYEFVKWQHTHTRTSRTGCMDILIVCHRRKHFVYIYMFIYCMSHKWLLRMWYGCYHNSHTTTSSTKSSIILYYLLGPSSSCRHTTPFQIIHIVIVLRFDLHLIKFMINNSIANQHTHTHTHTKVHIQSHLHWLQGDFLLAVIWVGLLHRCLRRNSIDHRFPNRLNWNNFKSNRLTIWTESILS